jgi:hypothetical protein
MTAMRFPIFSQRAGDTANIRITAMENVKHSQYVELEIET